MEIRKRVGKNLKEARKAKGYTQEQIANEMQMRQNVYSRFETGYTQMDYEKIVYLCKKFDITPNDLFEF